MYEEGQSGCAFAFFVCWLSLHTVVEEHMNTLKQKTYQLKSRITDELDVVKSNRRFVVSLTVPA